MTPRYPPPGALAAIAAIAAAVVAVTWWWASTGIGAWENDVVEALAGWPDLLWWPIWLIMQLGTLLGAVVGGSYLAIRGNRIAPLAAMVAASLLARVVADLIKGVVERPRPNDVLTIDARESTSGFGYPSSHSAMAAAAAVAAWPWLSDRLRVVAICLAGAVGLARMVGGVHYPLDVAGGLAVGTLAAVAVTAVAARTPERPQKRG